MGNSGNLIISLSFPHLEMQMLFQTKARPEHNMSKSAAIKEKQVVAQPHPQPQEEVVEKTKNASQQNRKQGVLPAIITSLLLIPLVLVVSIGLFICWRRNSMYSVNCVLTCKLQFDWLRTHMKTMKRLLLLLMVMTQLNHNTM